MRTGFNTELKHGDTLYHVQTEDKDLASPVIETLVYVGGRILDAFRTSYEKGLGDEKIDLMLEKQHRTMMKKVKSGAYTLATAKKEETQKLKGPQKGLDEMIIDYLHTEAEKEHLEISITPVQDFVYGRETQLTLKAQNDRSKSAIAGVLITVQMISTAAPPAMLFKGQTNEAGETAMSFQIPTLSDGNAAVIIKGKTKDLGSDELKQFVKRVK